MKMLALVVAVAAVGGSLPASDEILIDGAVLVQIEHVDVPAAEAGRLMTVSVHEGERVTATQPIAGIDDEQVRLARQRAQLEYEAAKVVADDTSPVELARKGAEKQRQLLAELEVELSIAQKESENDVPVRAAEKAMGVAGNQHQRALRAREKYKDAVSDSEIDGLKLAYERATLDLEQTRFERAMKHDKLAGKRAALLTQKLAIEEADLEVRQAEELHGIAVLQASLKRHDIEAASLAVARRTVVSPIDGVIVERYRHAGEWVEPGEKVVRIIRLDRLRAEGFVKVSIAGTSLAGRHATIEVDTPDRGLITKQAIISFVSPEVDPINQEVRVWAEFDNEEPQLSPGMRARVHISSAASKAGTASAAAVRTGS